MFSKPFYSAVRRILALAFVPLAMPTATARASFLTYSIGGTSAAGSIQDTVDAFRAALGGGNNGNNPGPLGSGRREINWDGGGAATAAGNLSPLTTFTNTRGSTFTTDGRFLQTPLSDPALTNINPSYATTFSTFSPQRIFTSTGSNVIDVTFSVPGTNGATPATVSGFGAVFSDVDLPNVTRMEFFDSLNAEIANLSVLPGLTANGSLSFLGAVANAGEQIARVRITAGNAALGPDDGGATDVVVMDDFIYSEPAALATAVPEPNSALLAGFAAVGAGWYMLRRRWARLRLLVGRWNRRGLYAD